MIAVQPQVNHLFSGFLSSFLLATRLQFHQWEPRTIAPEASAVHGKMGWSSRHQASKINGTEMAIRRKTVFQQPMVFRAQVPWYIPQEADRKPGDVNPAMKAMDFHGPAFPPVVLPLKKHDKNHGSFSMESNHPGLLVRSWEQGKWSQTFPDRPRIPFLTRWDFHKTWWKLVVSGWTPVSLSLPQKKSGLRELRMMEPATVNGNFRILKWRYLPYIRPI